MTVNVIRKGGRLIPYIATGTGPIERFCSMACCGGKPKHERYIRLPCGCHTTFVKCTCPLSETHCNRCGRNFITTLELKGKEWFEIKDPHFKEYDDGLPGWPRYHLRGVKKGI